MSTPQSIAPVSRRAALGGVGAAAATLGLSSTLGRATTEDAAPADYATHPIVGAWLVLTPPPPAPVVFAADGTLIQGWPANYVDPALGLTFQGSGLGAWDPVDERRIHFTSITVLTDAAGAFAGTFLIEGHPLVGDNGQTFTDNTGDARLIMRDATNTVVSDVTVAAGVTAVRITPGSLLPAEATPATGTPTS